MNLALEIGKMKENETININERLNDDCLEYILKLLPIIDRLSAELVCKKWQLITNNLWRSYRTFDIADDMFRVSEDESDYNVALLEKVFKRCAPHIVEVNISLIRKKDQMILFGERLPWQSRKFDRHEKLWKDFGEILQQRSGIEELTIDSLILKIDDSFLCQIFSKNQNIRFLHLANLESHESTFLIPCNNLETLIISECYFHGESLNWQRLCESTKLKQLSLYIHIQGKMQDFDHFRPKCVEQLYLDVNWSNHGFIDMPNPLGKLQDPFLLKIFTAPFVATPREVEDMVNVLTRPCENLVALDLSRAVLTDVQLNRINASLPKLACLTINYCADDLTDRGISNINENLKSFVAEESSFTDEGIRSLLQRAESLEQLDLCGNVELTRNVATIAIDAMESRLNRKNFTPLEIGLGGTRVFREEIDHDANPLLKFNWYNCDQSWHNCSNYIHL